MTFFEEIKRNVSDVADKAIKKTNEFSAYARLNVNIKTLESKLDDVYEEIGRLFYTAERSGEDKTSEIAEAIIKVDGINSEIDLMKKELGKFRKVKTCPGCGSEISINALFCSQCGYKQEVPEPEEPEAEEVVIDTADDADVEFTQDDNSEDSTEL